MPKVVTRHWPESTLNHFNLCTHARQAFLCSQLSICKNQPGKAEDIKPEEVGIRDRADKKEDMTKKSDFTYPNYLTD